MQKSWIRIFDNEKYFSYLPNSIIFVSRQMQAWLVVACATALAALVAAQKPGRFLSLPVPSKCANSKYNLYWQIWEKKQLQMQNV